MLSKLGCDELQRYGLNVGDLLDLIELVRESNMPPKIPSVLYPLVEIKKTMLENGGDRSRNEDNGSSSCANSSAGANRPPADFNTGSGDKCGRPKIGAKNSNDGSQDDLIEPFYNENTDKVDSSHDSDSNQGSDIVQTDDEAFVGFASQSEVSDMVPYERIAFKARIKRHQHLVSQGFTNHPKPTNPTKKCLSNEKTKRRDKNVTENSADDSVGEKVSRKSKKRSHSKGEDCVQSKGTKLRRLSSKKKKRSAEKDKPRAEILQEHKAFLSDENLRPIDKEEIRNFLEDNLSPKYSILNILASESKNNEVVASLEESLENDGVVFGNDVTKLVAALMEHLYAQTDNPSLITAQMREGLAVCLVATFPKLAHEPSTHEEKPWSWIYDRRNNKGKLANYHAHKQRTSGEPRLRGGGSKAKKSKGKTGKTVTQEVVRYTNIDDLGLSKDARYLRLIVPDDRKKQEIEELMDKTFDERRKLVADTRCTVSLLLQAYPHLKSFEGRMIDDEFEKMFKDKGSMLIRHYADLVPKLLAIAKDDEKKFPPDKCLKFADSAMNSLVILSLYLPKPKRVETNLWERSMEPLPTLQDFFVVIPSNDDMRTYIIERREKENSPVQPYILAKGTYKNIESIALVLGDTEYINLSQATMPLRAVDLLIKANYVLGTHFYLGWKYVFRFLIANVYKMKLENPRHSAFTDQYKSIMGN